MYAIAAVLALPIVAAVIALPVAAVLALASRKPGTFRLERSTVIRATPETIFALLNDFRQWATWSPWEEKDPSMTRSFSGPETGPGAAYAWAGNRQVGSGRMEVIGATPPWHLTIRLEFLKPFRATNTTEFALAADGDGTRVTWSMEGPITFPGKVMGVFLDMEALIGKDYDAGLARLKAAAEASG